jgi:hypothetical protein
VHIAHHPRQHGAVAHAGIENAQRRRPWMDLRQFHADPFGHHPLLAAGVDEGQIFLPVIVEPEGAFAVAVCRGLFRGLLAIEADSQLSGVLAGAAGRGSLSCRLTGGHEVAHPLQRARRHAFARAQAANEFTVVDRHAAKSRLRDGPRAAEFLDFVDQGLVIFHTLDNDDPRGLVN